MTKSALHRTRLRFSDHKNFSVLLFYKTTRQTAPYLGLCALVPTEIIEINFSFFQFCHFFSGFEARKKSRYLFEFKDTVLFFVAR
ncbi:hypothetical protein KCQ_01100 [Pectobacterium atrosepticum ICMP 1526]|uniref:hypothetical protein n=1 Tax=Pectobacterium atrosepticum TaxID=29471 RepID=UPI00064EA5BF|nr:hypothetical protein [Pectobacterium atrosepticum]KMK88454.1 hypothetical protein KCQ_01100 [Pectobacterium atrosepticum ICMP 1526]